MSAKFQAPEGFVVDRRGRATLVADPLRLEALRDAGLGDAGRWIELARGNAETSGRGRTAVVPLTDGTSVRLKQLRRGGLAGPLWQDRMVGRRRLLDNVRLPREAARRGMPTPRAAGLMMLEGPPGLYRGWLAADEIPGVVDLASCFASGNPPTGEELAAALRLVRRMHDAGVEHRDLNLGNLLIRRESTEVFVVDLDGARLHDAALDFPARQRALRRLERSYVKVTRENAAEEIRRSFYALYADAEPGLARRLERGRSVGRLWIRLHGLAWPRKRA